MNTTLLNVTRLNVMELNVTRLNSEGLAGMGKKGGGGIPSDLTADLLTEAGGFFRLENGGKVLLETKKG